MINIRVTEMDHIVLNVADVEKSLEFYCETLGLEASRVEEWRNKTVRFPSVRVNPDTIIDLFEGPSTGENLNHFCLVIEPIDFEALRSEGRFSIESGPKLRTGARGSGTSIYVRDPDQNLVELRYYD